MADPFVTATINYCGTEGLPPRLRFDLTAIESGVGAPRDARELPIYDARRTSQVLSLDGTGFTLLRHETSVSDFNDEAQVEATYYPEIEALLRETLGADEVFVFGHILRADDPEAARERNRRIESRIPLERSKSGPAGGAHVDFDEESTRAYIPELAGEDRAEALRTRRVINVNLWRGMARVERMPLALCDGTTVDGDQMVPVDMYNAVGPCSTTKVGLNLPYSPLHRWYYYPLMETDEVLLFKTFDSDTSVVQRTPHSAFVDPTSAPDAPPRWSMEVRALCFLS